MLGHPRMNVHTMKENVLAMISTLRLLKYLSEEEEFDQLGLNV